MERKVKYNLAYKLKCIQEVLEKHESVNSVSTRESIAESLLRKWIDEFKTNGVHGLQPKAKNSHYSTSFKIEVLNAIKSNNLSLRECRIQFDIASDSTILQWQRKFANFGIDGLKSKPKGRLKIMGAQKNKTTKSKQPLTREQELLIENERLRCENALLKKFNALVQAEKSQRKRNGQKP